MHLERGIQRLSDSMGLNFRAMIKFTNTNLKHTCSTYNHKDKRFPPKRREVGIGIEPQDISTLTTGQKVSAGSRGGRDCYGGWWSAQVPGNRKAEKWQLPKITIHNYRYQPFKDRPQIRLPYNITMELKNSYCLTISYQKVIHFVTSEHQSILKFVVMLVKINLLHCWWYKNRAYAIMYNISNLIMND